MSETALAPMQALDAAHATLSGTQLIEASAGTGKTWTLCVIYLRLLLETPLKVQQILVVTFTTAAVAELRERIRARLLQARDALERSQSGLASLEDADALMAQILPRVQLGDTNQQAARAAALRGLHEALQDFDQAAIHTIHAFCQSALQQAVLAGSGTLDLQAVAEEAPLRLRVAQAWWREVLLPRIHHPALAQYLVAKQDSPQRWAEWLERSLRRPGAQQVWPEVRSQRLDDVWQNWAIAHAEVLRIWPAEAVRVKHLLEGAAASLPGNSHKPDLLQKSYAAWDEAAGCTNAEEALARQQQADTMSDLARLGSAKLKAKAKAPAIPPHPFFGAAQAWIDAQRALTQALQGARLALMREWMASGPERLRQAHAQAHTIGYNGMLQGLHERVCTQPDSALVHALRKSLRAALIDEFQDTDPLQFEIFERVFGRAGLPLVLVGDPKQSIYQFRGADLHAYLRAARLSPQRSTLLEHQRACEPLMNGLNALFSHNPAAFVLQGVTHQLVRYGSKPRAGFEDRSADRAAFQLWQLPLAPDGEPLPLLSARQMAAASCASEVARLLRASAEGLVRLGEKPLAANDIAIVVRTRNHAELARAALARLGLDSARLSEASIFASPEAADMLALLSAWLHPTHTSLLRAALATVAMGWDAQALAESVQAPEQLEAPAQRAATCAQAWREQGLGPALRCWLREEGVRVRLLALPDGERRLSNVLHLSELLAEQASSAESPQALLQWLRQRLQAPRREDEEHQLRLAGDASLVQIVTIHGSKGLEYPLVFLPFAWDAGGSKSGFPCEWHQEGGQTVLDFSPSLDPQALASQKRERHAEDVRLWYVALTRAVHRCTMVIGHAGKSQSVGAQRKSALNWLLYQAPAASEEALQDWFKSPPEEAEQMRRWHAFAEANAPGVACAPLPPADTRALAHEQSLQPSVAALAAPPPVPGAWWIGSFSALVQPSRTSERPAADHDLAPSVFAQAVQQEAAPLGEAEAAQAQAGVFEPDAAAGAADEVHLDADDVLRFPRGPVAGELVHAVFEHADFSQPQTWPHAIDTALGMYRLPPDAGAGANEAGPPSDGSLSAPAPPPPPPTWQAMLLRMLRDVLATPLSAGLALQTLRPAQRLSEWAFHLRAPGLRAAALEAWLRREGIATTPLDFGLLQGYLQGFVDLVFEHGGRYHLIDWKSNHLGSRLADYNATQLARSMHEHAYGLQGMLYALALHRHLRASLPGYRHELHFGQVMFLFVRGLRPSSLPRGETAHAGEFSWRPSLAQLEGLDALLEGRAP
jgi:exodeoxyribonuclease V beta subunit